MKSFLVHLSRRLTCTIVIMCCPSSLTFHIFIFSSETAERNSTKLDRKQDHNVLYQVCVFRANRKNKMATSGFWLAETFLTSPLLRCPSSLTFHIFIFSSETTEWNSTKLDGKQDLNVLYQVCVFRTDRKNKMAALASDWLRHFWLLWNCWTEFNETWQEARSQCPLPNLCFTGRSEKQDGRPGLWLAETFDRKQDLNVSHWLRHFRLFLWTEFNESLQEARSRHPVPSLFLWADQ